LEISTEFPQKTEKELLYKPAIPFLGIYTKECKAVYSRDTCTAMFIDALITIAKLWNQSRCPSMGE
jgi:hypothetical protein